MFHRWRSYRRVERTSSSSSSSKTGIKMFGMINLEYWAVFYYLTKKKKFFHFILSELQNDTVEIYNKSVRRVCDMFSGFLKVYTELELNYYYYYYKNFFNFVRNQTSSWTNRLPAMRSELFTSIQANMSFNDDQRVFFFFFTCLVG